MTCLFPKPEKKKKNKKAKPICENPSCGRVSRIKYKGYFTYQLCLKCHYEWYGAFCEWIHNSNNWTCEECNEKKPLTLHHIPKRSQGGRHTKDHGHSWCNDCHKPEHGQ